MSFTHALGTAALVLVIASAVAGNASANAPKPAPSTTTPHGPPPEVVQISYRDGFDWGDAGIGAAGGLGLSTLVFGGGLVINEYRGRRSNNRKDRG